MVASFLFSFFFFKINDSLSHLEIGTGFLNVVYLVGALINKRSKREGEKKLQENRIKKKKEKSSSTSQLVTLTFVQCTFFLK